MGGGLAAGFVKPAAELRRQRTEPARAELGLRRGWGQKGELALALIESLAKGREQ